MLSGDSHISDPRSVSLTALLLQRDRAWGRGSVRVSGEHREEAQPGGEPPGHRWVACRVSQD